MANSLSKAAATVKKKRDMVDIRCALLLCVMPGIFAVLAARKA
jgi:hypothetical protein